MSDNANSHPLIVDLKDHTPALEHDALFEAYNEGATADEKELELLQHEFCQLSRDFEIWAAARVYSAAEQDRNELARELDRLADFEDEQLAERSKLQLFVNNVKRAFEALFGRS